MPSQSKETNHKHKCQLGIRNELKAAMKFLEEPNNHVYYELGGRGPADLIVVNTETGTVDLYDIKTKSYRKDGSHINRVKNKSAKNLNVKIIHV
tara:strand:- start:110 stop:391 length:282 start_codon:yes stop_codon:yes gene_type:complete